MRMTENEKNGTYVPKKTIEKQLRQEEAEKAKDLLKSLKSEGELSSAQRREKVYKKNMGLE